MWKIKVTAMAKTLNKIIQTHCHKGLSAAKIFRVLKGTVSCYGVGETGVISDTGLPRTRHFRFDFLTTTCHNVIFEHSSVSCNLVRTWNAAARQSNF